MTGPKWFARKMRDSCRDELLAELDETEGRSARDVAARIGQAEKSVYAKLCRLHDMGLVSRVHVAASFGGRVSEFRRLPADVAVAPSESDGRHNFVPLARCFSYYTYDVRGTMQSSTKEVQDGVSQ